MLELEFPLTLPFPDTVPEVLAAAVVVWVEFEVEFEVELEGAVWFWTGAEALEEGAGLEVLAGGAVALVGAGEVELVGEVVLAARWRGRSLAVSAARNSRAMSPRRRWAFAMINLDISEQKIQT